MPESESVWTKMGMPGQRDTLDILNGHRQALTGLLDRLEPEHIARDTIKGRIKETNEAIKAERSSRR